MRGRLAAAAPVAASLLAHGALVGVAAGVAALAPRAVPAVLPRPSAPPPAAASLRLLPDGAAPAAGEAPSASVSLDDADPARRPYLDEVRARIWARWEEPPLAPGEAGRGALSLEFTLAPAGGLAAASVTASSGSRALDRAAIEAVRRSAPFPAVPEAFAAGPLRVRARFVYE